MGFPRATEQPKECNRARVDPLTKHEQHIAMNKALTSKEKAANADKWLRALGSGRYKKTTGQLGKDGAYCCLGVACKVTRLKDVEMSDGEEPRLVGLLGIRTNRAALSKSAKAEGDTVDSLVYLNDNTFDEDKGFGRVRKFIVDNIDKVFTPAVARHLSKMGYRKN